MKKLYAAVAVLLLFVVPRLSAAPLARHVPASALIYLGWNGQPSRWIGYQGSRAQQLLAQSQLPEFFHRYLPEALNQLAQAHPPVRMFTGLVWPNLQTFASRPWAFYFDGLYNAGAPGQMLPRAALLVQASGRRQHLMLMALTMLCGMGGGVHPQSGEPPLQVGVAGRLVYLFIGKPTLTMVSLVRSAAGAPIFAKSMAHNRAFNAAMRQVAPANDAAFYMDIGGLRTFISQLVAQTGKPNVTRGWNQFVGMLHLERLQQLAAAGAFYQRDFRWNAFLSEAVPADGNAANQAAAVQVQAFIRQVPKGASSLSIHHFDLANAYRIVQALAGQSPGGAVQFNRAVAVFKIQYGVDLSRDIFQALGSTWLTYTDSQILGRGMAGIVLVNHPRFPRRLSKALPQLANGLGRMFAAQTAASGSPLQLKVATTRVGGIKINYLDAPLFTPAWCFFDHNLYVGLYPQSVLAAVQAAGRSGSSMEQNPSYASLLQRLGKHGSPVSLSYHDLPRDVSDDYSGLLMLSRLGLGMLDIRSGLPSPAMVIPSLSALRSHLDSAGTVSWYDAAGWHWRSVSPFPGSSLLTICGNGGAMPNSAFVIAALLPAMAKARELANRTVSAVNERSIVQSCIIYAQVHAQKFPPNLATLVASGQITPTTLLAPDSGTTPANVAGLMGSPMRNVRLIAARLRGHCDYIYAGTGMMNDVNSSAIVVYERPGINGGRGCNVGFGDDHVEWIPAAYLSQTFKRANAIRKIAGLPPLEIPPSARVGGGAATAGGRYP